MSQVEVRQVSAPRGDARSPRPARVDIRAPRFGAWVTSVVLAVVLVTGSGWLLAVQGLVFAVGAAGLAPYGLAFRLLIAPRLGPARETEDARPPRFAQAVGLLFAVVGTIGYLSGVVAVGVVATSFALIAALLNAAVGLCLGCELYLTWLRARPARG